MGNYFAGYETDAADSRWGSSATIEYNNPDLCGSDTNGGSASTAWAMIASQAQGHVGVGMYAQVGYGQFAFGSHGFSIFAEYTKKCKIDNSCAPSTDYARVFHSAPTGAWTYVVTYEGGTGGDDRLNMCANGAFIEETNYNPIGDWETAWKNEIEGETWHTESDVVGLQDDKTSFTSIQNQHTADGTWVNVNNSNLSGSTPTWSRYNKEKYSSSAFRIWTYPLHD